MPEMGKIRRLPAAIREELNQRLQDGADFAELERWLNAVPEVEAVMAGKYRGARITHKNLSDWKRSGFVEWEAKQKTMEVLEECAGEEGAGIPAGLGEKLARWVALRYAAAAHDAAGEAYGSAEELKLLKGVSMDVARMRRGDQNERWLELEGRHQQHRERIEQLKVADRVLAVAEDPELHKKICPECSKPVCYTPKLWQIGRRLFGDEEVDEWERENAIKDEALRKEQEELARLYAERQKKLQGDMATTFWQAVCIATGPKDDGSPAEGNGQCQTGAQHKDQMSKGKRRTNDQNTNPKE